MSLDICKPSGLNIPRHFALMGASRSGSIRKQVLSSGTLSLCTEFFTCFQQDMKNMAKMSHKNHTLRLKVKERWRCSYSIGNKSFPYITVTANTEQDETGNSKMTAEFVPWIITISFCIKQLLSHDSHHVIC